MSKRWVLVVAVLAVVLTAVAAAVAVNTTTPQVDAEIDIGPWGQ